MDIVVAKIGADEVPGKGFIPTLQLEECDGPRMTVIPFYFSETSVRLTVEDALKIAENEAKRKMESRYPKGTKCQIDKK